MNQSQSNPVGLRCFDALRANCACAVGSCALIGQFLPPLLAVICMHSERRFVLQRRIWPKYIFKGDAPPSVSSAARIFAEGEAFIFACLLCDARLTASLQFLKGFPLVCFVVGCLLVSLSTSDRCLHRDVQQQDCSRATPACEMAEQEITTPICFSLRHNNLFMSE